MKGDVVTFFHASSAKKWPLAVVEDTYPGKDGQVRVVLLRLPRVAGASDAPKTFKRDVGDVALLLPADAEQQPNWI